MLRKISIFLIILLILVGLGVFYLFVQINVPISKQIWHSPQNFIIQKGQGVKEISRNLKEQGMIRNKFIFESYVFLKKIEGRFQAGEYKLKPDMNMIQIAKVLTEGIGAQNEREIKIIEGWTIREISERIMNYELRITKDDFLKVANDKSFVADLTNDYNFLKDRPEELTNFQSPIPNLQFLEGYLFPDTYRIYKDATAEDIIKKMLDNFDQKLTAEMREEIKRQNKTIFEIVTMASIIEKEVPNDKDRAIVSGIFWKRRESGMPLQADSTLNYFTGNKSRALSAEELKIDSFYNTYLYPDLPPTPISNPGLSALRAAIYPEESPYWYFLSKKNGETVFSRTLEEHNINKALFL